MRLPFRAEAQQATRRRGPIFGAALGVAILSCSSARAQTGQLAIDFGSSAAQAGGGWNNVHPMNSGSSLGLSYLGGGASGIVLEFTAGKVPTSANSSGVTSPPPGSPLGALGWPSDALRDSLWGSTFNPEFEFTLTGLDPTATYDFTIVASRLGAGDVRTVHYTLAGLDTATTVLDAADNATEVQRVLGLRPDASNSIRMTWSASPTNTNASAFYYLNALGIDEWSGGSQSALVAFTDNVLETSRVQGQGSFGLPLSTYTNGGATPTLMFSAVDDATQSAATWLSLPATAVAGDPLSLTIDPTTLPLGDHSATLVALAPGLDAAFARVSLHLRPPGALNLLFYGNSYSDGNGGVHENVRALAEQAGLPSPKVVEALAAGQTLNYHLTDPAQAAKITESLVPGEAWDFVVLQGFSLEATVGAGNPAQFNADAQAIFQNVRAHSPSAKACLFQTWARGWGNQFYPATFQDPPEMHAQIEASYMKVVDDLNSIYGPDTARRAAAGEAVALRNFDPSLYDPDLSHPGPSMSFMAADAIFTAIWSERVCDLSLDFDQKTNLIGKLNALGIGPLEWREDAGIAERAGTPSNRLRPGSGEDLVLRTAISGLPPNACPQEALRVGQTLTLRLESPVGEYDGTSALLWIQAFHPGVPPVPPPGTPEVHFDASSAVIVAQGPLNGPLSAQVPIPKALLGRTLIVQGQVLAPSANTGNAFTTTDAHVIRIAPAQSKSPVQ